MLLLFSVRVAEWERVVPWFKVCVFREGLSICASFRFVL